MRRWFISGGRSGVGKTFVAKQLCAVLPNAVYAKCGCGTPKHGKSPNFFNDEGELEAFIARHDGSYENAVIESNALGHKKKAGDISIFLEARVTAEDVRGDVDELRGNADIRVGGKESRSQWKGVLEDCLDDPGLVNAVLDILAEQQRRLSSQALGVRSKIWFVNAEDEHIFGSGLAQLLVEVEHLGSLKSAAERTQISYQHAVAAVRRAEEQFGRELIKTSPGGIDASDDTLTETGKRVMALYLRLNEKAATYIDAEFAEALAKELDDIKELL